MWSNILCIVFTAGIIIYHYEVIKPKSLETHYSLPDCWIDFVNVNIDKCKTVEQCMECMNLIECFDKMFRTKMPKQIFMDQLEKMWNRADTKYKALKIEDRKFKLAV